MGKVGQLADMVEDALGEAPREVGRRSSGDIVVDGIEMVTRFRREDDGMYHVQPRWGARLWRSASPALTLSSGIPRAGSA